MSEVSAGKAREVGPIACAPAAAAKKYPQKRRIANVFIAAIGLIM